VFELYIATKNVQFEFELELVEQKQVEDVLRRVSVSTPVILAGVCVEAQYVLALFTLIPGEVDKYNPNNDVDTVGLTRKVTEAGAFNNDNEYSFTFPGVTLPMVGRPGVNDCVPKIVVNDNEKLLEREP